MNFHARQIRFTETCIVKRSVGSSGQYSAPTAVASGVPCTPVFDVHEREVERADMTTVIRETQMFARKPDSTTIEDGDLIVVGGETFTVSKASPLPHRSSVQLYALYVELKD